MRTSDAVHNSDIWFRNRGKDVVHLEPRLEVRVMTHICESIDILSVEEVDSPRKSVWITGVTDNTCG